jgi:UDP-3-O-[3-hydroxymyristoyl] glucosamine N-acyltransferase
MLGTLDELAVRVGGRVLGDGSVSIARITAVDETQADALTFATDERYLTAALASTAAAVLVDASVAPQSAQKPLLVVDNARGALATLLAQLRPQRPRGPFTHPTAAIDPTAQIGAEVYVGPGAFIGADAVIGDAAVIDAGAYVAAGASIGAHAWLHPRSSVMERCEIGDRVALHAGCVIGSEGFGWAFVEGSLERIPQVGNVVLECDVEVGANTCIDRAQTGSTRIGEGTKIDNLVQIGHNCRIGKHCAIAALTGLAGSTTIGDYVKVAGQVGFKGHITVGSRVSIAGQAGVWGNVPDGMTISGNPAIAHRDRIRQEVLIRNLPKLVARVEALESERDARERHDR